MLNDDLVTKINDQTLSIILDNENINNKISLKGMNDKDIIEQYTNKNIIEFDTLKIYPIPSFSSMIYGIGDRLFSN
jgi:hypothetical protein